MRIGLLSALLALPVLAQPLPASPGALNPDVTQANIRATICKPGWTKTIRPALAFTDGLKRSQMVKWHLPGKMTDYEEDHRVPLELGGAPNDPKNLWPEPWTGQYNAHDKDRLENALRRDVCAGRITLRRAQSIFLGDFWIEYRRRFESK